MRTAELANFVKLRHKIYCLRQAGKPKPWTGDPILQQYRFCNVYRELDKVTVWIAKNWRMPHRADPELWFAMTVARLVNWPDTLQHLGYPVPWRMQNFIDCMRDRMEQGKAWGGAYIVSTNGNKMDKELYIASRVLNPLWTNRKTIDLIYQQTSTTLAGFHNELTKFDGLGSFLGAQVIADLKYVKPLSQAKDWHTWAASGPGSRRGMNRLLGQPIDTPCTEALWLARLQTARDELNRHLHHGAQMAELHAQDVQNCLCEWDKYERVRLGEGHPKATYQGGA